MAIKHRMETAVAYLKQYKYALLIVLAGLFLLLIPESEKKQAEHISQEQDNILSVEQQLARILSNVKDAGKVLVFLSQAAGEEILYQTDEEHRISGDTNESQITTVTISGADRGEGGLIRQVNPPTYLGAVIVCQGADNAVVRLAIVDAVSRATGLGADKISVLKMG